MHTTTPIPTRLARLALALSLLTAAPVALQAQTTAGHPTSDPSRSGALFDELARMDSLLFHAAFVECDADRVIAMVSDDVEFYHDQTGFHSGDEVREDFRRLAGNCPAGNGVARVLATESLQVFPINDYGAVQTGVHRFVERGSPTNTVAKFVHLWQRRDGTWTLTRVLSYDHRPQSQ